MFLNLRSFEIAAEVGSPVSNFGTFTLESPWLFPVYEKNEPERIPIAVCYGLCSINKGLNDLRSFLHLVPETLLVAETVALILRCNSTAEALVV